MRRRPGVAIAVAGVLVVTLAACGRPAPATSKPNFTSQPSPTYDPKTSAEQLAMSISELSVLPGGAAWLAIEVGKKGWSKAWLFGTSDGGKNWKPIAVDGLRSVDYVRFFDPAHGVLVDEAGSAIYSTDDAGGQWWRYSLPVPADGTVPSSFVSTAEGWVLLSGDTRTSTLYHTADRGKTWNKVPAPPSYAYPGSVSFRDSLDGWLGHQGVAGPELFQTKDGGRTWRTVELAAPPNYPGIVAFTGAVRAIGGSLFTLVSVAEGSQAVGSPGSSYIYSSADNGVRWTNGTLVSSGPTVNTGGPHIEVVSPTLWFAAIGDRLRVSADAGQTWTTRSLDTISGFVQDELVFATASEGYLRWARASDIWSCMHSCFKLERTIDGGASWQSVTFPELPTVVPTQ